MTSLHSLYWMLSGVINSSTYVRETRTSRASLVSVLTNRDNVRCTTVGANSSATNRFARIIFEKYSTACHQHAAPPDNESEQALLNYLREKSCENFVLTLRVEPLAKISTSYSEVGRNSALCADCPTSSSRLGSQNR